MTGRKPSLLQRALNTACDIHPREVLAVLASFGLVLMLMAAYYILRPVRDAMASDWSDAEVSLLWTLTFIFSAVAVSLYGGAVARIRLRNLVPSVYGFFAVTFILFFVGIQLVADRTLLDKSFYVWISVFSLFHISVFWSFMADTWDKPQATRLFGFIGAGASIGAMIGPALTALLAAGAGVDALLLIGSSILFLTLPLVYWLQRLKLADLGNTGVAADKGNFEYIGGNPFAGFSEFLRSPYLLGIALFIFFYTSISSFIYFELKNLMVDYDRETRTQIWAAMDLVVNTLTVIIAAFATGRIARHLGLPFTLACIPVVIGAGLLLLAATPIIAVVVAVQIVRRAGNYAITRPGREMLFTAVDQETRFKAKPVIDIVIYRGGDMLNAWAFTALTQGLGLGLAAVALVGAGVAVCWAATGIWLGRRFNRWQQ
ncbi:MFS transporter [Kineobactrum sediminis]|uniref:MFS transporter n=1 Tax=Kineobactrum sediminis TaxID=1905677 RepID=A0A2N5Y5L1_9GAMM|nr:MFS transporter [Kineobactrum sediminis]PLW83686.1 MFS transporter [Kineobactrum sediminis]